MKKVKESQELINSRLGESQSFYIKARDVSKCGPTKSCPGCSFVFGEISTQIGIDKKKIYVQDAKCTRWSVNREKSNHQDW